MHSRQIYQNKSEPISQIEFAASKLSSLRRKLPFEFKSIHHKPSSSHQCQSGTECQNSQRQPLYTCFVAWHASFRQSYNIPVDQRNISKLSETPVALSFQCACAPRVNIPNENAVKHSTCITPDRQNNSKSYRKYTISPHTASTRRRDLCGCRFATAEMNDETKVYTFSASPHTRTNRCCRMQPMLPVYALSLVENSDSSRSVSVCICARPRNKYHYPHTSSGSRKKKCFMYVVCLKKHEWGIFFSYNTFKYCVGALWHFLFYPPQVCSRYQKHI